MKRTGLVICVFGLVSLLFPLAYLSIIDSDLTYVETYHSWKIYKYENGSFTAIRYPDPLNLGQLPNGETINHMWFGIDFTEFFYNQSLNGDNSWQGWINDISS